MKILNSTLISTTLVAASLIAWNAAAAEFVVPGPNLVPDGMPAIPRSIAERVHAYSEFSPQRALSWHPGKRELLISRRAGNATQLFRLGAPGDRPEQLTRFPDPVSRASYPRRRADYLVFAKDEGGDERFQLWRHDIASGNSRRLTDGAKRHGTPVWSKDDALIAYTSVAVGAQRDSRDVQIEIRVMDPLEPASDRLIVALPGAA